MRSPTHPQEQLVSSLGHWLNRPADDVYVEDLAHVVRKASPNLMKMLDDPGASVTFAWHDGELYLESEKHVKRLLP